MGPCTAMELLVNVKVEHRTSAQSATHDHPDDFGSSLNTYTFTAVLFFPAMDSKTVLTKVTQTTPRGRGGPNTLTWSCHF